MVQKKSKMIFLLMIFLVTLVFVNLSNILQFNDISTETTSKTQFGENNDTTLKTSAKSKIITINGNIDLNNTAISGNGTRDNPYIIKDLEIDANGSFYCVLINNTDKSFILIDCVLYNASYGIYLNNVSNGIIANNFANDHLKSGFFSKESGNISIIGNSFFNNRQNGIFMENCSFYNIEFNSLRDNLNSGAYLNNSNNNNLTSNFFKNNHYGIYLHSSNYTYIVNNTGQNNIVDICEINCKGNVFENNNFQKDLLVREFNNNNSESDKIKNIIIDFSLILISIFLGLICFIITFRNFKYRSKISKISKEKNYYRNNRKRKYT